MSRFDKAEAHLLQWRDLRTVFRQVAGDSAELQSVMRAVDAAFKSEVQESRIRSALYAQALNESDVSRVPPTSTLTGQHLRDFDWWLTESTLRSLHSGIDALAQLLNILFDLKQNPDEAGLPKKVCEQLQQLGDLGEVLEAVQSLWHSPECRSLSAFVNHVKHAGFPQRHGRDLDEHFTRSTLIDQFTYDSVDYGPWFPQDIDVIIDGFRMGALDVLLVAARELTSAG